MKEFEMLREALQSHLIIHGARLKFLASLVLRRLESWILTMDRTNWKFGRANINIIALGVAYFGSAIALFWIPLPKAGNSKTSEKISINRTYTNVFPVERVVCLTADWEFVGEHWFKFLLGIKMQFRIRIKENFLVTNSKGFRYRRKTCSEY